MQQQTDRTYVPREHVTFRATPDGGILVNMATGACFELNGVGADVWVWSSAGSETTEAIAERVSRKYGVPLEVAVNDVNRVYDDLIVMDLVVEQSPSAS